MAAEDDSKQDVPAAAAAEILVCGKTLEERYAIARSVGEECIQEVRNPPTFPLQCLIFKSRLRSV
jgi:hypothetical protein